MKAKVEREKEQETSRTCSELLKNTLLVMKTKGVLVQRSVLGGDSLWELTWLHVNNIAPCHYNRSFPRSIEQVQE
ncbi:hypothetical protein Sjap_017849 [Stephania japonica]|uniref:Uncharacterized protein n=1 Tax=Stephania japonica TaxID=461633 RepID=A0AAP0I6Z0_9MAGN